MRHLNEYRAPKRTMQGLLNPISLGKLYSSTVPRKTQTSSEGRHTRPKNPDHPVAKFCAAARRQLGLGIVEMSEKLDKSRSMYIQYEDGTAFPSAEVLLQISRLAGLSLGMISSFDQEQREGKPRYRLGDFESRYLALNVNARPWVDAAMATAETASAQLPRESGGQAVNDNRLSPEWAAPQPAKPAARKDQKRAA